MALLCCFLLIVEKIPIVECERLYELTWSSAQSEGSKWPLGLRGPARTRAESARATSGDGDSAWEGSGEVFQALINEKACFELAGPQEQLAKWDEEIGSAGATQAARAAGRRSGARRPSPVTQPRPQASRPRRRLQPRWGGTGAGALSPVLQPRAARAQVDWAKPA